MCVREKRSNWLLHLFLKLTKCLSFDERNEWWYNCAHANLTPLISWAKLCACSFNHWWILFRRGFWALKTFERLKGCCSSFCLFLSSLCNKIKIKRIWGGEEENVSFLSSSFVRLFYFCLVIAFVWVCVWFELKRKRKRSYLSLKREREGDVDICVKWNDDDWWVCLYLVIENHRVLLL